MSVVQTERFEELLGSARRQIELLGGIIDSLTQEHAAVFVQPVPSAARWPPPKRDFDAYALGGCARPLLTIHDVAPSLPQSPPTFSPRSTRGRTDAQSSFSDVLLKEEASLCCDMSDAMEARELLHQRADPNMQFGEFQCMGQSYVGGTPLAIVAMQGRLNVARVLLEVRADPDSSFSFIAGTEEVLWAGPALNAAVMNGNLDMVRMLVEWRADMHCTNSNESNLLWVAAYTGQVAVAEHLIESRVDIECRAQSQDDLAASYTTLHVAAVTGHTEMVAKLLEANACVKVTNGQDVYPLEDAIVHGYHEIVRLLLMNQADIFRRQVWKHDVYVRGSKSMTKDVSKTMDMLLFDSDQFRSIDLLFSRHNHVLTSAAAGALRNQSCLCRHLMKADLVKFLNTPGDAPLKAINAIFQPFLIRFWAGDPKSKVRMRVTSSYIHNRGMNVAEGPCSTELAHFFDHRQVLPSSGRVFLDTLAPSASKQGARGFAPVVTLMCQLPLVHRDLEVLLALADNPSNDIFSALGCQAIISFGWHTQQFAAKLRMVLVFVEVVNLALINILLNEIEVFTGWDFSLWRSFMRAFALVVWLAVVVLEALQWSGYTAYGLSRRYIRSPSQWFDLGIICLTGVVLVGIDQSVDDLDDPEPSTNVDFRLWLGVVVAIKWARLLQSLSTLKFMGLRILPIITTMFDIGPFCAVLGVYFLAAVNLYYALGIKTIPEGFLVIYRLVILGDMDLSELEGQTAFFERKANTNEYHLESSHPSDYYWSVRCVMLAVSFVMGLAMMNLFIAMLCLSYSEAIEKAIPSLLRLRLSTMLDQEAMRSGFACWRCVLRQHNVRHGTVRSSSKLEEVEDQYLWLSVPDEFSSDDSSRLDILSLI